MAATGEKRRFVDRHRREFGSVSAACAAAGLPVSTYYYEGKEDEMTRAAADAPNEFRALADVENRLLRFQDHYETVARPFQWKFTRRDLDVLLAKLNPSRHRRRGCVAEYVAELVGCGT